MSECIQCIFLLYLYQYSQNNTDTHIKETIHQQLSRAERELFRFWISLTLNKISDHHRPL